MFTWPWSKRGKRDAASSDARPAAAEELRTDLPDTAAEGKAKGQLDTTETGKAATRPTKATEDGGASQAAKVTGERAEFRSAHGANSEGSGQSSEAAQNDADDDPYALPDPPEELPACLGGPIADMSEVAASYDVAEQVRLFLVFDGTVQGVGFRWTTQSLANKVGVTGWVRNMSDGTVQAQMQGTGHDICRVLCALRGQFIDAWANYEVLRRMKFHFVITRCERMPLREGETTFDVHF